MLWGARCLVVDVYIVVMSNSRRVVGPFFFLLFACISRVALSEDSPRAGVLKLFGTQTTTILIYTRTPRYHENDPLTTLFVLLGEITLTRYYHARSCNPDPLCSFVRLCFPGFTTSGSWGTCSKSTRQEGRQSPCKSPLRFPCPRFRSRKPFPFH